MISIYNLHVSYFRSIQYTAPEARIAKKDQNVILIFVDLFTRYHLLKMLLNTISFQMFSNQIEKIEKKLIFSENILNIVIATKLIGIK